MDRYLVSCLLLVCLVFYLTPEAAAQQKSRVCFAQSSDYSTSTAIGFCTHAVYIAYTPTSKAFLGVLNSANDADDLLGGIRKFVGRKTTYPWVQMYIGVLGSISVINWLNSPTSRKTFIDLLLQKMPVYPEMSGVYLDIEGVTNQYSGGYANFVAELNTALIAANLKLVTALPWDATTYGDLYFNPTLPTLPFNVIKTHEDMYSTVTTTHPLNPLFSIAAPFNIETKTIYNNVFRWVLKGFVPNNIVISLPMYSLKFTTSNVNAFGGAATTFVKDTYCNALLFGAANTVGAPQAGEGYAYSSSTFYTYNSADALIAKLNFATSTNMGGVAVYSLDQAGSVNTEMLRQITSILAPTPATGVTYPEVGPATCGVPVTFPTPPTTTTVATTTTTTTPTTTTTTTTPTTTTTTTTPTTTTTTTTPTTTTTTTPTTTTTTTTPTTTTTTTTPTTTTTTTPTTTTTTPTTTTTTTTPTTTTTTTPTTTTTTTTPTTTTTTTTPTTTTTTTPTTTTTTPTTTTTTTTPTTTTTTTPTTTTTTTPTTTTTTTTPTTTTTTTPTTTTTTTTPTTTTTTTPTTTTTTTPTTTTTTTTPTTTTTTTTPTTTTTTTPTTTTTTTTPTTTTSTTPTTTTTSTPSTTTTYVSTTVAASADSCGLTVNGEYGNLVSEYCAQMRALAAYLTQGASCGVVADDPSITTTTLPTTTTTTTPTTTTTTTTTTTPTTTTTTTLPTTTTTTTTATTTTTPATTTFTTTTTAPTTTTMATPSTTVAASPATCNLPVAAGYFNLVDEYCAQLTALATYLTSGASCGVVA